MHRQDLGFRPDEVMGRVGEGIGLGRQGDRDGARRVFARLWREIGGRDGDPLHRCAVAHSMADVQDDAEDELAWDLLALEAADSLSDERAAAGGVLGPVSAFYPSLHLNLGDCYRRLGRWREAREHVDAGRSQLGAMPDSDYVRMLGDGLTRLARAVDEGRRPASLADVERE